MNFVKTCAAGMIALLSGASALFGDQSPSLKDSFDRIHEVAVSQKYYHLTPKEKALIKEIAGFGPDALPYLADLIDHPKRAVTVVAAEAIEEIAGAVDSIDGKFLPAILHGLDDDHSGLPNALAKIKTDDGRAAFVERYLRDSSSPHNQYQNGFARDGVGYLPRIIKAVGSDDGANRSLVYLLGAALANFKEADGKVAAVELLKAFDAADAAVETKRTILILIGKLGESALQIEDRLIAIWKDEADLADCAAQALVGIGSTKAGVILAKRLESNEDPLLLRDIAEVGLPARDAGDTIAKLLEHADWELRLGAARTIGFIGYRGADARLIELLDEPSDVRLNFVAAESLGRLGAESALEALKKAAEDHWHPAVRKAASTAADRIQSGAKYPLKHPVGNFPFEYFDYEYLEIELPDDFRIPAVDDASSLQVHAERDPGLIAKLTYPSEIVSYGASDEEEQKAKQGEDAIIAVNEDNMVERRRPIAQTPQVGVRVHNGWLLGSDRGEWGGELVFKGDDEKHYYILKDNINELFKLGERIIAVAGLAHLTMNDGLVYEVSLKDGKWQAERWRVLPGAPRASGKLKSGEVMVATEGGGVVVLSEDGSFRMADSSPESKKATEFQPGMFGEGMGRMMESKG